MSEPTYGSGQGYEGGQGYGGQQQPPQYGGQPSGYGGQQYGGQYPPQAGPPTGPSTGGFPAAGYSGGTPLPTPATPRNPADRLALAATIITIVGYVCAGAGLLGFILNLTINYGDGSLKFAAALRDLVVGIGLGGLNFAVGTWLASRPSGTSTR